MDAKGGKGRIVTRQREKNRTTGGPAAVKLVRVTEGATGPVRGGGASVFTWAGATGMNGWEAARRKQAGADVPRMDGKEP